MRMMLLGSTPMIHELPSVGITAKILAMPKPWRKAKWNTKEKGIMFNKVKEFNPDIFWIMKDPYINNLLPIIKKRLPNTKIVMWYGDQRGDHVEPLIKGRIPYLSALLITNGAKSRQHKMYKRAGIPFVHTFYHSFSPNEFQLWDTPVTHDVFFGGSNFRISKFPLSLQRRNLIYTAHKRFNMVVHGGGWKFPTEKWILRPQYAKALRKAHINIGINHYDLYQYYNRRLFEAVGSGRLHVTYYIPGMEKHFKNHEHLVWFKNNKKGMDLIKYYLNHDKEREQLAQNGRDFFIENHSWKKRVKQLRNIFNKL